MLHEFWENFSNNLFKPLLMFFYLGFLLPILKVQFEFPYVLYQGLTIYLLLADRDSDLHHDRPPVHGMGFSPAGRVGSRADSSRSTSSALSISARPAYRLMTISTSTVASEPRASCT